MNAATYTAIVAASDSSPSHLSQNGQIIVGLIVLGLIAAIVLIVMLDGR